MSCSPYPSDAMGIWRITMTNGESYTTKTSMNNGRNTRNLLREAKHCDACAERLVQVSGIESCELVSRI